MRTIEEIMAALQAIIDASAGRTMTAQECTDYEALETELADVRRTNEVQARHAAHNAPAPGITPAPAPSAGAGGVPAGGTVAPGRPDDGLERAFEAFLRTGTPNADLSGLAVTATQSTGTGSEGGYLVPTGFRTRLIERMKAFGGIATIAEQVVTTNGAPLPWPTVDDTSNVGEVVTEGGTHTGGAALTFGSKALGAYEYQSGGPSGTPLRLPWTLLQDSGFDISSLVARKLGERLARAQAAHLSTGTGVGQPLGLVHGLTGIEPADDTAGITYSDLLTFIHSVDPLYRPSARWVFNDNSLKTIEQIKDSNGDPLWRSMASTIGDAPSTGMLLNYPYTIDQGMPDIDIDNNTQNWGAFGDIMEGYVLRRVRDVQIVVNPWTRAAYRETEFTAWARMDATQQNTNAYVALTGEA
jgi:HK97 family phage major capsid protein